ncbi:MAG: 23S rRNA (adenine(2503)-C(2))-methyltransferase RlmN [Terriglobia bacterium]
MGLTRKELRDYLASLGEKPFHGDQIYESIYCRRRFGFSEIHGLPLLLRQRLSQIATVTVPLADTRQRSTDRTTKYLFRLGDGQKIESVFIPEPRRDTLCLSTQVGCPMDCRFCLTALIGFTRNLTAGEIVGQILSILKDQGESEREENMKTLNIVLMGMGEPLLNLENVSKALTLMADESGLSISPRHITLSTVGLVPKLLELAKVPVLPNLAISLSATTDTVRNRLMPVNRKYPIEELMAVCAKFPLRPRQRITFEYVLIDGENDTDEDARRLAKLLSNIPSKVNLLPLNLGKESVLRSSSPGRISRFQEILVSKGVAAFIRRPRGADIFAACGQLHRAESRMAEAHS